MSEETTEETYEPVKQDALEMAHAALAAYTVLCDEIPEGYAARMAERFAITAYANIFSLDLPTSSEGLVLTTGGDD